MKKLTRMAPASLLSVFIILSSLFITSTISADVEIVSPADGATVGGIVPITITYWGTPTWPVYYVSCSPGGAYYESYVLPVLILSFGTVHIGRMEFRRLGHMRLGRVLRPVHMTIFR